MQIIRKKNSFTITDFKIVPKYKYKSYSRNDEKIRTYIIIRAFDILILADDNKL